MVLSSHIITNGTQRNMQAPAPLETPLPSLNQQGLQIKKLKPEPLLQSQQHTPPRL